MHFPCREAEREENAHLEGAWNTTTTLHLAGSVEWFGYPVQMSFRGSVLGMTHWTKTQRKTQDMPKKLHPLGTHHSLNSHAKEVGVQLCSFRCWMMKLCPRNMETKFGFLLFGFDWGSGACLVEFYGCNDSFNSTFIHFII